MAYDEGLVQIFRDDLADHSGIDEKKMFGGICFMYHGNMLCGIHKDGAMFRVGKDNEPAALDIVGAKPLGFTGRKMGGLIDVDIDAFINDDKRAAWLSLAFDFVGKLPAK
jgi:TfoX/Sxy family transcriptional regulator of competence genes